MNTMSSLPQGWHSAMPTVQRNSSENAMEALRSAPRKKWNSPQVSELKTMVPKLRKKTPPSEIHSNATRTTAQKHGANLGGAIGQPASCPPKPNSAQFHSKDSEIELSRLKQEFAVVKSENSILKAKFRKLDDDNKLKARQLDKLQAQFKESTGVFRQKCTRLESTLREKEQIIKKLMAEIKSVVASNNNMSKRVASSGGCRPLSHRSDDKVSVLKQNKINVKNQAPKVETERLKFMVHKLEDENQTLNAQIKEKDIEIRRLKLHIQQKVSSTTSTTVPAPVKSLNNPPKPKTTSLLVRKSPLTSSSVPFVVNQAPKSSVRTIELRPAKTLITAPSVRKATGSQRLQRPTTVPTISPSTVVPSSTFVVMKTQSVPKQKVSSVRKPKVTKLSSSSASSRSWSEADARKRAQTMRENIAARKIQKGWRHHKKMMQKDLSEEEDKALNLLASAIVEKRAMDSKLEHFSDKNRLSYRLTSDKEQNVNDNVALVFNELWQDVNS